jgi:hypothetical protein
MNIKNKIINSNQEIYYTQWNNKTKDFFIGFFISLFLIFFSSILVNIFFISNSNFIYLSWIITSLTIFIILLLMLIYFVSFKKRKFVLIGMFSPFGLLIVISLLIALFILLLLGACFVSTSGGRI